MTVRALRGGAAPYVPQVLAALGLSTGEWTKGRPFVAGLPPFTVYIDRSARARMARAGVIDPGGGNRRAGGDV